MALNKNFLCSFLKSSGNFASSMVSSIMEVATYCFKRLCNDITRIEAFSLLMERVVGSCLRTSGRLSPLSSDTSESNLPVADATKMA